jgi:DNA-directed RNA polymerase subunit RPC12/RpoP
VIEVQRNAIRCRICGALLGRLGPQHDVIIIAPSVAYCLTFAVQRFDLFCPVCGTSRRFAMTRVTHIVRDRSLLDSQTNLSDCERAVG